MAKVTPTPLTTHFLFCPQHQANGQIQSAARAAADRAGRETRVPPARRRSSPSCMTSERRSPGGAVPDNSSRRCFSQGELRGSDDTAPPTNADHEHDEDEPGGGQRWELEGDGDATPGSGPLPRPSRTRLRRDCANGVAGKQAPRHERRRRRRIDLPREPDPNQPHGGPVKDCGNAQQADPMGALVPVQPQRRPKPQGMHAHVHMHTCTHIYIYPHRRTDVRT